MAALPAVSKTFSARGNVAFTNVTTALAVAESGLWGLKQHMKDAETGGVLDGTRHANSVWTVRYSCDSVTAGSAGDAVDRWTTFANLIWAANGTAHSWFVLRNATLGYEVCLDCINATSTNMGFAVAEIATPFTGGTTTTRPTATNEFSMGNTAISTGSTFLWLGDAATGNFNWTHYITADDGQFYFLCSRTGLGVFSTFMALQKTTGASGSDTRNVFAMGHALSTTRGAPSHAALVQSLTGCIGRLPNGGVNTSGAGGLQDSGQFGATPTLGGSAPWPGGFGIDSVTGNYLVFPCHVSSLAVAQPSYRGFFPDQYSVAMAPVGASIPSAAAQERIIAGDFIIPFPGVNPTI